jgi:hypothetical protein
VAKTEIRVKIIILLFILSSLSYKRCAAAGVLHPQQTIVQLSIHKTENHKFQFPDSSFPHKTANAEFHDTMPTLCYPAFISGDKMTVVTTL